MERKNPFSSGRSDTSAPTLFAHGNQAFNSHHRPVGVDGDVGAVVVEDGAGAVDDFLVALDLRHDLLLHLQRRQGDFVASFKSLEKWRW